jgi:hypothetical protein
LKLDSFYKKLKKQLGEAVIIQFNAAGASNIRKEWCFYNGQILSWFAEEPYSSPGKPKKEMVANSFHSRRHDDEPDLMTDYFPGTYWKNATQMLDAANPPPLKFPPGSLVRGKPDNKRAKRMGYAGKLAIVIGAGCTGSFHAAFVKGPVQSGQSNYRQLYAERDFELVSGVK